MNFFHGDGEGGIVDQPGKEASTFVVDPSIRLTNLTVLPTSNVKANQNQCHWSTKIIVIGQPKVMPLANQNQEKWARHRNFTLFRVKHNYL
ncbi:hypothetical protein K501DRAFT_200507 [Backusella circina FSU 941]|nr:hypothetical protein K501DRAFT_200507 [Backusella circina FSU 941]